MPEDLVQRDFAATGLDEVWFTDITEHPTSEGRLYLCAVKDACSGRIVGYSMDSRMTSRLTLAAIENAVTRRGEVAGCPPTQSWHPHRNGTKPGTLPL